MYIRAGYVNAGLSTMSICSGFGYTEWGSGVRTAADVPYSIITHSDSREHAVETIRSRRPIDLTESVLIPHEQKTVTLTAIHLPIGRSRNAILECLPIAYGKHGVRCNGLARRTMA